MGAAGAPLYEKRARSSLAAFGFPHRRFLAQRFPTLSI
jgi:hypothetical protein